MQKVVENYVLYETVGSGQYGKVYRSKNTKTNETVAVKVIPMSKFSQVSKLEEFTTNEIKTLARINNENVVRFIEMLKTANNMYLVYEFCDGGTLEDILQKQTHCTEQESLHIFRQLLNAFKSIYKENIIHRDLKPANILLHNNIIKIADFGFCKRMSSSNELTFTMVGSPIYMAPEILKGFPYNIKSDIWSLGVVLYECLFGICPYEDRTLGGLISRLDKQKLTFPTHKNPISKETEYLIRKMLTLDHKKRIEWEDLLNYRLPGDPIAPEKPIKTTTTTTTVTNDKPETKPTTNINEKIETAAKGKDVPNSAGSLPKDDFATPVKPPKSGSGTTTTATNTNANASNNGAGTAIKLDLNQVNTHNEKSQRSQMQQETLIKTLMKERNQIVFTSNLLHSILEMNVNNKAAIVAFLVLKRVLYMIDVLKKEIAISNNQSKFIGNPKWEDFTKTDEYLVFSRFLEDEYQEAKSFMEVFKPEIQSMVEHLNDPVLKQEFNHTSLNQRYLHTILVGYADEVKNAALEKFRNKDSTGGMNYLLHSNEILDCDSIEEFFDKVLVDGTFRLSDQSYFSLIKKFNKDKLQELVIGKLGMAKARQV